MLIFISIRPFRMLRREASTSVRWRLVKAIVAVPSGRRLFAAGWFCGLPGIQARDAGLGVGRAMNSVVTEVQSG